MIRAVLAAAFLATPALADPHPEASRVLALGGAVTEIVYALGQQERLIARDSTSSFPAEVMELPDVGYVRALSAEGVLSVSPDLILSEEGAGPPETIAVLQEAGIPFETIPEGRDAEGLERKIETVAEALDASDAAAPIIESLRADLRQVDEAAAGIDQKKKVLFILSLQGGRVMAGGRDSGAEAIITLAGAENAITGFDGYKPLTDEAITAAAPDVILMMNRGAVDESDHGAANDALLAMPAIATTPAARDRAIIRMDGLYLLGFGPRTGRAALDLHRAIYGEG